MTMVIQVNKTTLVQNNILRKDNPVVMIHMTCHHGYNSYDPSSWIYNFICGDVMNQGKVKISKGTCK